MSNDLNIQQDGRLLRITFALGDLISVKLSDSERARRLYEKTLEYLYGFRDADPLRTRLKILSGEPPDDARTIAEHPPERLPI